MDIPSEMRTQDHDQLLCSSLLLKQEGKIIKKIWKVPVHHVFLVIASITKLLSALTAQ